jgi:RNA polymerase sigma-70 factor (ECF subfamily)
MKPIDQNVRLAAAGDMEAFGEIYRCHTGRVFSLCLRMTHNRAEAEDLTQDVFVQVFRKLKTFRGESSFTTWLHRVTINHVLMHFRKPATVREKATEDSAIPIRIEGGTEKPSRMSLVDRVSLKDAIRQLAPGHRLVFILHDVEGYEHAEIGHLLGCAVGTSKSQLHKARVKLRHLLSRRIPPQQTQQPSRSRTKRWSTAAMRLNLAKVHALR